MTKFLKKIKSKLSIFYSSERGFLTTKIIIAISTGILILSLIGGAIWYGKYQAAKKAEEEKQKLQTRIISPTELPMSAQAPTAPIIFLTTSPDLIKYDGADKAILFKVAIGGNPTSCAYSWDKNLSSIDSKEYNLIIPGSVQTHQIYTVTCESDGGNVSKSATVTISAAEPPTINFLLADKNQVEYKKSATLTWSSKGATNCDLKNMSGETLSQNLSGSKTLSSLTKSDAYIITCSGPGGQASDFTSITVNVPPSTISVTKPAAIKPTVTSPTVTSPIDTMPTLSLSTSTKSIAYNSSTTLSWSASNISGYCMASSTPNGTWSGIQSLNGSEEIKNLTENTIFTLNCGDDAGNISKSASIEVSAAPVPIISLSANPASVSYNSPTTLTWSVTNATSCSASGTWSGSKKISGSEQTGNLTNNKTYTLTCSGISGGSISKSASVTVGTAPTPDISFSADPTSIFYNGSSKLSWSVTNATSCSASGGWFGSKKMSGSEEMKNLTNGKTYTLTCAGAGGSASKSASVTVSTTYAWAEGAFGSCSTVCGGGTQTKTITCKRSDGQTVTDSNCPSPKPPTSQSCNMQACVNMGEDTYVKTALWLGRSGAPAYSTTYGTYKGGGPAYYQCTVDDNEKFYTNTFWTGSNICQNACETVYVSTCIRR